MEVVFVDDALRELYEIGQTADKRYRKYARDRAFVRSYVEVLDTMRGVEHVSQLKSYSFLHYEKLRYRPESSVRIKNGRIERLIFTEHEEGIEIRLIEIDNTHYGNKH